MIQPGMAWPPPELGKVLARVQESRIWLEGHPDKLESYYQRGGGTRTNQTHRAKRAWDAFWGRAQVNPTQEPKRLHVPIAKDIAQLSTVSLFAKPPSIIAAKGEGAKVQARADKAFNAPRFHSSLYTAGMTSSALGGVYGRVVWDETIKPGSWIEWVDPDCAIGEWRRGQLAAVTFFTEHPDDDGRIVWRHLERYELGRIVHQLFHGTRNSLGRLVPLADHDATATIPVELDRDGYSYVDLGVDELAAEYVPNKLPNPEWSTDLKLRYLGGSDISADLIPIYHGIDRIYSSLMRDFRAAAAKVYASNEVLTNLGPGQGLMLPDDQEMFTRVGSAFKDGDMTSLFEFYQPDIRVLAHDQGGEMLLREVLRSTGYSPVSFGLSDEVAMTATEASGKKEWTVLTTEGKSRYFGAALAALTTTCLRVDAVKFPGLGAAPAEDLRVEWPKFAVDSAEAKGRTVQSWDAAGAASTRTKVAHIHEDWSEKQIDEEVALIDARQVVPDPFAGLGPDQAALPVDPNAADNQNGNPADNQPADTVNAA